MVSILILFISHLFHLLVYHGVVSSTVDGTSSRVQNFMFQVSPFQKKKKKGLLKITKIVDLLVSISEKEIV